MRKFLILFLFFWLSLAYSYQDFIDKTIGNHRVKVIKVILDGNHKIVTSLSKNGEDIVKLMDKVYGVSAINGAYFCPADYPNCGGKNYTNAPRFYKGKNYSKYGNDFGINGVFAFDKDGRPFMVMNHIWGEVPPELDKKINVDKIDDIYYGIGNFPVLLFHGVNFVGLYKNYLSKKMKLPGSKAFICSTKDGKTIYMGYVSNITIYQMPKFLKDNFSCYNALNLDAGASLGLICNGKIVKKPWRPIMDAFVVVDTSKEKKVKLILQKYNKLIDSFVKKVFKFYSDKPGKIKDLINKIETIKYKYKNNFEIFVVLNELQVRLGDMIDF